MAANHCLVTIILLKKAGARILEAYLLLLLLLAQVHLFDIVLQAEFLQNNFDLACHKRMQLL